MANQAPSKVTIQTDQTRDFSNVHNFVKKFVWDPIQSTYSRIGANHAARHLRLKKLGNKKKEEKVVQSILTSTVPSRYV